MTDVTVDPLLLEALRFGTGILAGGVVAVIAQRLALGHQRRLQHDERDQRTAARLRALRTEIDENISRIGSEEELERRLPVSIERSAWDVARESDLPDEFRGRLAAAYAVGQRLNDQVATIDAYYVATATATSEYVPAVMATQAAASRNVKALAKQARSAFEAALEELRRPEGGLDRRD